MRLLSFFLLFVSWFGIAQDKFDTAASSAYQKQLDKEYADPKESPLMEQDFKTFKGLDFYPIDAKYIVQAKLVKSQSEKPFEMKTTGTRRPMYVKYGEARFILDGKSCKLNIYRNIELSKKEGYHDYLFLPFSDLTSGKETYIGGRYIELRETKGETVTIDFNRAFNPYCAYNHNYSCPIVPLENDLAVEIKAGVKKFHD
ncbi:DUF1684 domain-containing protein [Flavobacterium sp. MAH-1]|uniref:DUF1684 domain-containing protein n=1 Tax=Flavobacterium agri TaxID=2743471 RepID=A0A7Y9C5W1_9FLAO|nr:DUF1684 domain-containing protein [Flavobacterium agri]NUY79758.1 DUF1684 domain-containing protein [Flavobacterium agri]NYA69783.1 DUF1684 domain-containing protein [Flavobacterium agri]